MKVGLFIPCYIDQLYPQVGMATVKLLADLKVDFEYPMSQTCCGQPMSNTGCIKETIPVIDKFVREFKHFDAVVCPSGSCTAMIKHQYPELKKGAANFEEVNTLAHKSFELCEFLLDVLKIDKLPVKFPYKVGIHQSCHGLRELGLGSPSEIMKKHVDKVATILSMVKDIDIRPLSRTDECCGFGGLFSILESETSCQMGRDRIKDHATHEVDVITSADMSCLMHMEGLIRRNKDPLRVKHVAEILAGV